MAHHPTAIGGGIPPYAVALVQRASVTRLVVYAGAGISLAEPAGLPTGAQVAQRVHARLKSAFPQLDSVDPNDLVAVGDSVASLPGGEEAVRMTAVNVAEFSTAEPTYGHQVLALLLLEGVLDVFTTNWDNCIERSGQHEHVPAVVTGHDLLNVAGRRVIKIHGCCTQPNSLLLTTEHLEAPPSWVADETRARLADAVVVFVGIGDIAGYVKRRLEEAIASIGSVTNIRLVSPGIVDNWASSQWSQLVPTLAADHRIAASADEFLEKLGAATRLTREARNRLERHVSRGAPPPTFVVGGGIGWTTGPAVLPTDILAESNATDVIDGPASYEPTIKRARDVLAA